MCYILSVTTPNPAGISDEEKLLGGLAMPGPPGKLGDTTSRVCYTMLALVVEAVVSKFSPE